MSDEKEFRLKLPGYVLTFNIEADAFDSEEAKEQLKARWKRMLEREFKHWIENDYEQFFEKEVERNREDWKNEKLPLSERLLRKEI